jgi:hypothetical protein
MNPGSEPEESEKTKLAAELLLKKLKAAGLDKLPPPAPEPDNGLIAGDGHDLLKWDPEVEEEDEEEPGDEEK